jgi:hypothetical protein
LTPLYPERANDRDMGFRPSGWHKAICPLGRGILATGHVRCRNRAETRHSNTIDFICDAFRNDLCVDGGVLRQECASLYRKRDEPVPFGNDPAHDRPE